MHVLRNIDRDYYHFDFLVSATNACAYDDEIRALGSKIISCPHPQKPFRYGKNFVRLVRKNGPYDIIHSHVHHFSGFNLLLARLLGIRGRISHSHNDTRFAESTAGLLRKLYLKAMKCSIHMSSTQGFFCSEKAAESLYGEKWNVDQRWISLYCGIDFSPFKIPVSSTELRDELNISPDAFVVGHVGRFSTSKNHSFLLEIFAALHKMVPTAVLLLVGDGALREDMEIKARALNIHDSIIFAGVRPDVPAIMRTSMNVFCFPSLWEGLPVTVIEAQAAGLPCVLSDSITNEVAILDEKN
jgi:glycosyltransferase involved in cell wall biosynthesis